GNDKIGSDRYLYKYLFTTINNRYTDYSPELYNFGQNPVSQFGIQEGTLGNENVTWEIAKKANLGIDLILFNNKLDITADIFQEKRSNILVQRQDVPTQSGLISSKLPA